MPFISPSLILVTLLLLTLLPATGVGLAQLRHRRRLRAWAASRGLSYTSDSDEIRPSKLLPWLPLGAANVAVSELFSRPSAQPRLWLARADYALGSVAQRRHQTVVLAFCMDDDGQLINVHIAPPQLSLMEQYQHLTNEPESPTVSAAE